MSVESDLCVGFRKIWENFLGKKEEEIKMTPNEKRVLERIIDEVKLRGDGFSNPEIDYGPILNRIDAMLSVFYDMIEFETNSVETRVINNTVFPRREVVEE